jgi:hypothetical protein
MSQTHLSPASAQLQSSQLALFSSQDEAQTYHDSNRSGFFSLLVDVRGDKRQSSHLLSDMPTVLGLIDKPVTHGCHRLNSFAPIGA